MSFFKNIFSLFFPNVCLGCNFQLTQNEFIICTNCRHHLTETNITNVTENFLEKNFYGRVPLHNATALLFFEKKNLVKHLIHKLKYKNHQEIGELFGNWLAEEIKQSNRFKNIDYIVPVPLHPKKEKTRGYNQLTTFGKNLAKVLNVQYCNTKLLKVQFTNTQTRKNRFERWKKAPQFFNLSDIHFFENKHILLIDDVITTGATIEACANELLKTKNIKISVAVMAYTK